MFQAENVVYKIFGHIPVSIRYPNNNLVDKGCPDREYIAYILYKFYGGASGINMIHEDVISIWYNNKGNELVINTRSSEGEMLEDGMSIIFEANNEEIPEINIVKQTAKALGMTQKELAEYIGVAEDTLGKWSRGKIDTPQWAVKMFKLLIMEKKFNTLKQIFSDELQS